MPPGRTDCGSVVRFAAVPGDVAGAAGAEERLGRRADALRGRQPRRRQRDARAAARPRHAAAAHRAAHAPRAHAARPSTQENEGIVPQPRL